MRHVILDNDKISNLNEDWSFKPSPYNPEYLELDNWPKKLSAQEAKEYLFLAFDINFGVMDTDSSIVEKVFPNHLKLFFNLQEALEYFNQ